MKQVVVIPARFESTRLSGKPLVKILGKSLIHRVWSRCVAAVPSSQVYVATDDERIHNHCASFGAQVVMTSKNCLTGTDRLFEANKILKAESVINVQGDEPLVNPEDIALVARRHLENTSVILNGMGALADESEYRSPTVPKVVATPQGRLLICLVGQSLLTKSLNFAVDLNKFVFMVFRRPTLKPSGACPLKLL